MCGRTVCNLRPDIIQQRCQFVNKKGNKCKPKNRNSFNGQNCIQSYNISPSQTTPILFCEKSNEASEEFVDNRIIQPMRWGLIPCWFKETINNFKLKTHNAKIETILEKPVYKNSLNKGYRCVAIIEGFYEWNTKSVKQPYFIRPLADEALLYVAAVYDIFETENGPIYSYSILTEESHGRITPIHHRSPVILHDKEEIELWIDSKNVQSKSAIQHFLDRNWIDDDLDIYPVSTFVNSSLNDGPECSLKIENPKPVSQKPTILTRWLIRKDDDVKEPIIKKCKSETE